MFGSRAFRVNPPSPSISPRDGPESGGHPSTTASPRVPISPTVPVPPISAVDTSALDAASPLLSLGTIFEPKSPIVAGQSHARNSFSLAFSSSEFA
ncbi:hypothetical protein BYT27DRAFT_7334476 [Phlegmacium glaucopus]|nr:hypothetical protein BYT27DRAFT_7334476 [Phlegmacium glaucopus]